MMQLLQLTAQQCGVCGRLHGSMLIGEAHEVLVRGAVAFTVCPCCFQPAPDPDDAEYRARAEAWMRESVDP